MTHLFGTRKPGYLSADEAFAEGFNDIKSHQIAMIAGMRAAFEHMLHQFSPKVLEEQFQGTTRRGGLMAFGSKSRYWDMYRELFDRVTRDSDDNFRRLFGEAFATAYEEQMAKLSRRM
jgi:type VI secretion system protein ImpI